MSLTRREALHFTLTLRSAEMGQHRELVEQILMGRVGSRASEGDEVDLTYTLFLDYFNGCEERLQAVRLLAQSGVMVKASIEELTAGESVLVGMLDAIHELRGSLEDHTG